MGSRLAELQARYKQKQLQEMESKLKKLIPNAEQRTVSVQMSRTISEKRPLEERKPKAGIDKSYPLKPLKVTTTTKITQNVNLKSINTKAPIKSNLTIKRVESSIVENSANNENEDFPDKADVVSSNGSLNELDLNNKLKALDIKEKTNEKIDSNKKQPATLNKPLKTLNEKPPQKIQSKPIQKTSVSNNKTSPGLTPTMSGRPPPQRAPVANRPSAKQTPRGPSAVTRDDLAACKYCNRRFAPDRLQIHEDICAKSGKKKRKVYDALKHRVQGTELEPFARKMGRAPSRARTPTSKRSNWRQTHNEFINTIRAAKMTQAHIAKGGKISDLPPPPPSSNPDYVQCPYCGRRFNQTAAERHIPKCATYEFNKPKPGTASSKGPVRPGPRR